MAEKLIFDDGVKRLDVNGNGLLCFHPADFNIYQRFRTFATELPAMEERYRAQEQKDVDGVTEEDAIELAGHTLDQMKEIDAEIKRKLTWVFGPENDFDKLLNGVNLMSPAGNGERVITNFLNAITPYLEAGVKQHMESEAAGAVAEAKKNRAQRRKK